MPPPYSRHVFVCTNRRPDGSPRGCCATKNSDALRLRFKAELESQGVVQVRINTAGCLDACERGPVVVVYPDNVWYAPVSVEDVADIVSGHLKNGVAVERLRMVPIQKKTT
jgi:(2Fe-2S) ferredoxin